jgi:hypothetical protein
VPGPCNPPILEDDVAGHFTSYKPRTDRELATAIETGHVLRLVLLQSVTRVVNRHGVGLAPSRRWTGDPAENGGTGQ